MIFNPETVPGGRKLSDLHANTTQTMKAKNTRKEKSALNLKFTSLNVDLWALRNVHCRKLKSQLQDEYSNCAILVNLTFLIHKEAPNFLSMGSSEHPDSYFLERIYAHF